MEGGHEVRGSEKGREGGKEDTVPLPCARTEFGPSGPLKDGWIWKSRDWGRGTPWAGLLGQEDCGISRTWVQVLVPPHWLGDHTLLLNLSEPQFPPL